MFAPSRSFIVNNEGIRVCAFAHKAIRMIGVEIISESPMFLRFDIVIATGADTITEWSLKKGIAQT
jgi:hypothetical protein